MYNDPYLNRSGLRCPMGPFDFIKAINESKDVMKNDPFAEKDYIPFLVNRGLVSSKIPSSKSMK